MAVGEMIKLSYLLGILNETFLGQTTVLVQNKVRAVVDQRVYPADHSVILGTGDGFLFPLVRIEFGFLVIVGCGGFLHSWHH